MYAARSVITAATFMMSRRFWVGETLNLSEGIGVERAHDGRRSTRVSRRIPIVLTSLDPKQKFCGQQETVVVNAHGCGVLLPVQLGNKTPVSVELISNGRSKSGKIVLVRTVIEGARWLVGLEFDVPAGDFWEIENPPEDWQV